jgi:thymidylate synthase (FAD)|tara:strand:+ start:130 stop:798 length:669 start_codon:yes stop_codon:yes gene_type:complete
MEVNLIALSTPTAYSECSSAEQLVAYAARVSNPANQNNTATAGKLVRYLIKENHWSPLEMVSMTMEIKTTRDISRQILRHRSFSFQEFSQRYAESEDFIYDRECRFQDSKNRQNSNALEDVREQKGYQETWNMIQKGLLDKAVHAYTTALNMGIAKEQARALLPEGLTGTTLYMSGTLRSWIHYCELRMANGTQKEHMDIAKRCWSVIGTHFPDVTKAVEEL